MKRIFAILALVGLLGGCETLGLSTPTSPQQVVYVTKASLLTLTRQATGYMGLPRCVPTQIVVTLCSDQKVVDVLSKSIVSASAAVDAAEATVRDPKFNGDAADAAIVAAQNSVVALQTIVTTVEGGK